MKKVLLTCFLAFASSAFSQSYCVTEFEDTCDGGDMIDSFSIPSVGFYNLDTGCSQITYEDFSTQTINVSPGASFPFIVTHGYGNQNVKIWIDFNNDSIFDEVTELVASASSTTSGSITSSEGIIPIPSSAPFGNYRMRIATRYNSDPIPCNTDGYGEAHDYTLSIGNPPTCLPPTGLSVTNVGAYTATLNWVSPANSTNASFEYYISTSNTTPTATTTATGSVSSGILTKVLTNLQPSTNHYAWIRSICSANDKSTWMIFSSFKTLCAPMVPSYTNNFSVFPGNCWSQASGGSSTTGPTGTTEFWSEGDFLNSNLTSSAAVNLYSDFITAWLISNEFNLSSGGYRVKFDYGITDYYDDTASAMGSDDYVQLLISNDGGTTWSELHTWNAANAPSNVSTPFSLDLTNYNSATTKFAFFATDGVVDDTEDYNFYVDNFSVEAANLSTSENPKNQVDNIKAYPNPFADVLTISDITNVKSVSIIDIAGRVVKTIDKPSAQLQLSELKSGMYMVVLNMKDGSKQTIKAIKK